MSNAKGTTRGLKRKSSDPAGRNDNKKGKVNHDGPTNSMEKLFANEQCIQSILAYLPLEDLANVALATHFFKMNALVVFKTVHAASIVIDYDADHFAQKQVVFQQFGSLATKVTVSSRIVDDAFDKAGGAVLATIGHFCGVNLKELTLRRLLIDISPNSIGFSEENRTEVRKVLETITKLSLVNICLKSGIFQYLRSLQELSIHSCCHLEEMPQVKTLPQLKILSIGACPLWPLVPGDNFNEFLRVNPSIEEIDYHFIVLGKGHLNSISSLPKLGRLKLHMIEGGNKEIALLSKMKKLKHLKLLINSSQRNQFGKLEKMLSATVELENLPFSVHQH